MTESTPDSLFRPDNAAWRSLSPRYVVVKRLSALITSLVFWCVAAAASWIALQLTWLTAVIAGVGLAWTAWRVVRAGRWVRSWGWAERDSDLCITHGLWTRELTVIPFGRMQMVEVSSGPLLRSQGLANVQLITAAVQSRATIPGLPHADAVALRDRMIELSEAGGAGL
ncbi:MAG TPA: PH domain-containing protein [Propioniciclava tarda]|nr:PH domain-containing protein [Propioniciclava tarda]HQD60797.1 PH domain-containing protein [Propioniciclava tarda]